MSTCKNRKMTTRQSVIAVTAGHLLPAKGRSVDVSLLYSVFKAETQRFRKPPSIFRLARILDREGYRRVGGVQNGQLLDHVFVR